MHQERDRTYEGGGFCTSDLEAVFPVKRGSAMFCFVLSFPSFCEAESLGAFEVAQVWKSRVTTIKPLSLVSETPTSSQISALSGFTLRFPFLRVASQVLSHAFRFSVSHRRRHEPKSVEKFRLMFPL